MPDWVLPVYVLGIPFFLVWMLLRPPSNTRTWTAGQRGAGIIFTAAVWPLELVIRVVCGVCRAIGTLTEGV